MSEDPQKTWSDYYEFVKERCVLEAETLWHHMQDSGITEDTVLALDFMHIAPNKDDADSLSAQLSENYTMKVSSAYEEGYWYIEGTTRPEGITINKEKLIAWVEFMTDVAHSYACVFSNWTYEAPSVSITFSSKDFDSGLRYEDS